MNENKIINCFSFEAFNFSHLEKITLEEFINAKYIILGHLTTSIFLDSILQNGLLSPKKTNIYSNDDMLMEGHENYIWLTSHLDIVFAQNAVKKHGGEPILILVKIEPHKLELDNLFNRHSSEGIELNNLSHIYKELQNPGAAQARIKEHIPASNIVTVYRIDDNLKLYKVYENANLYT